VNDEWGRLGREIAGLYLRNRLDDLSTATRDLDQKIRDGETLTKSDIQQFRRALADLQSFVETDLTAVAEGDVEAYDGALFHVDDQALAEHVTGRQEVRVAHERVPRPPSPTSAGAGVPTLAPLECGAHTPATRAPWRERRPSEPPLRDAALSGPRRT
jgi:hypothetical protein